MHNTIRVLLVDDSPYFLEAAREFLSLQEPLTVVDVATEEQDALAKSLATNPDVILLDLNLAHRSGLELIPSFRKRLPHVKIIVLTMMAYSSYRNAALQAGADAFVHKSEMSKTLVSAILDTMRGTSAANPTHRDTNPPLGAPEAETQFLRLAEHLPDLIYRYEFVPKRGFTYVSPAATRMTGYTPEEHYADPDLGFKLIHPEDLHFLSQLTESRVDTQSPLVMRWVHKNGAVFWTEQRIVPIFDASGVFVACEGIARDITERKHMEAQNHSRLSELEAVARISAALRAAATLDDMLPILLNETLAVMRTDTGSIMLYDTARGHLRYVTGRGWFTAVDQTPMQPGEGIAGRVFISGEAIRLQEFASDPRTRESSRSQIPAGWGGICVPIRTAEEVVGVMFISVTQPRELTDDEIRLLNTLAEIAGNAIHRTRLHEQTKRRLQQAQALRAIDMAITSSFDLRLTLEVILDQAVTHLSVDAAAILLLSPHTQQLEYMAGRGFHSRAIRHAQLRLGEGYAGRAALERRRVHVANMMEAGGDLARALLLAQEAFVAYYGVPLIAKGEVKGVLEIFHRAPKNPDPEWLDFLETLAGQAAIAIDDARLFESLQRSNIELMLAYDATIEGWSRALDMRDRETEGHSQRVTEMTLSLARKAGMSEADLVHVRRGALLHDIGKLGVPDSILLKPGKLTDAEWVIMRQHPTYAYQMLSPIAYLRPALSIPYCHHETWDGAGYPQGLKGEQIPLAARLFAIVDVWDALRSDRPYRAAWPEEKVCEHIRSLAGTHFDPSVVEMFLNLAPQCSDDGLKGSRL